MGTSGYRVGTKREHPAQGDGRRLRVALLVGIADFNAFHGFKGLPSARAGKGKSEPRTGNRTLAGNIWRHAETKVVVTHTDRETSTCIDMQHRAKPQPQIRNNWHVPEPVP